MSSHTHWAVEYVGLPYQLGAQGPAAFDCWSFFRHIQRKRYGRDVPFMPTPPSIGAVARVMPGWAAQFGWCPTEVPCDGDAVFLTQLKIPTHIGVWVADLKSTLHCSRCSGSVLHDARHLAMQSWRVRGYFTPEV